jgi:hypothetical protein
METITRYHLKIVQTRPDTDIPWYDLNISWNSAWNEFNKYYEEVTETVDNIPTTKLESRLKFSLLPQIENSSDELVRTRIYYDMTSSVHDEFVALLNDDSSALGDEKRHAQVYGITHQLVSEEEVREVVPATPAPEESTTP